MLQNSPWTLAIHFQHLCSVQVPGRSSVVLVTFQPSVAFCAWYCMQLWVCQPGPDDWTWNNFLNNHSCTIALNWTQAAGITSDILANLVNLPADALLPEMALPFEQCAISTGQLEPHLELCLSFLTTFLKADHCGENQTLNSKARQAAQPPALAAAAITSPYSSKTSTPPTPDSLHTHTHSIAKTCNWTKQLSLSSCT